MVARWSVGLRPVAAPCPFDVPLGVFAFDDLCVNDNECMATKGSRAICFIEDPQMCGPPSYHGGYWEPLFASAQEIDLPACMHIGSGGD